MAKINILLVSILCLFSITTSFAYTSGYYRDGNYYRDDAYSKAHPGNDPYNNKVNPYYNRSKPANPNPYNNNRYNNNYRGRW